MALAFTLSLLSAKARAHFILRAPACYSEQDSFGAPLKSAPCGQADPGNPVVPTGEITAYVEGQVMTVTIEEVVTHPGHYRVAIAPNMDSLPADPPVTAGATPCGSTVIDPSPTLPVLADGLFEHTMALEGPQTVEIPLPPGFTCDNCVLQVTEFMSNHALNNPGGCFYHHCAMVTVTSAPESVPASDGGTSDASSGTFDGSAATDATSEAPDSSTTPPEMASGGDCGCRVASRSDDSVPLLALLWLVLGLLTFRRRSRARTA